MAETGSGLRLVRERLKADMNLNAVGGCSIGAPRPGERGMSRLVLECSTNGTSDIATFWWVSLTTSAGLEYALIGLPFSAYWA